VDKFDIAGGLAQAPIELVKCLSVDVEVPANAEFMLEGEVIPHRREYEGPFGESSGYYLPFDSPVAKIRLITHRRNPIYRALMPFWSEEDILLGLLWGTGADVFLPLRKELPFVRQVNFRNFTGGIVIVQIEKESEDDGLKVIDYLLPSPWVKLVVVTDEDVDIWSAKDVDWVLSRVRFDKNMIVRTGLPGDLIDPSAMSAGKPFDHIPTITKVGIDATKPLAERDKFEKIRVPAAVEKEIAAKLRRLV
jgi:2,5-furandicarboxylate decarboxylase 1